MATIKLTDVCKVYDNKKVAVQNFNLEIADREFIVFVGPSGCGKSTTLRMIAGLEDISGGTIEIDGEVVNDVQVKDRGIAMVFQNYALYPHMTVYGNIAFPLRVRKYPMRDENGNFVLNKRGKVKYAKMPEEEVHDRVLRAANILGIEDLLMRKPRKLSGGQCQRVAIGRGMVRDMKVFLLDEPLSNLDAQLRNDMRAELISLRKEIPTTFVYVTHDQTEAMTLADRIVIMKDGFIQQVGTPTEVFEMPHNLFVARFIGAPKMNVFRTRLERDETGYFVSPCGVKIRVDGEKGDRLAQKEAPEQDIVLGVRPEHIALTNSANPVAIPCKIKVTEMMGSEIQLHLITDSEEQLIVRVPTVAFKAEQVQALVSGATVFITFHAKVMHFFNAENEWNLLVDDSIPVVHTVTEPTEAVEDVPKSNALRRALSRLSRRKARRDKPQVAVKHKKWRKMEGGEDVRNDNNE